MPIMKLRLPREGLDERSAANLRRRIAGGLIGLVGYILSPLSWWNDAFVNIPLAIAFSLVLGKIAHISFDIGFVVGYWITNIAGILLMVLGGGMAWGKKLSRRDLALSLAAATAYTIAATAVYRALKSLLGG
jgi:hypothetical protein